MSTNTLANKITIGSGEIPAEMKSENFTIIGILKGRNSYDKYVIKEFSAYTGNYVLGNKKEINTTYSDITKYRYLMDYDLESSKSSNMTTYGYRYYIIDRKTQIKYSRKSRSSFFALEMRAYLKSIETVRKK